MTEIKQRLLQIDEGQSYVNITQDPAYVITADHTHSDILRHVIEDLGWSEAMFHLANMNPAWG